MIDSHCHLDFDCFASDVQLVIERSVSAGVTRWHVPGTTKNGWQRQRNLAENTANLDISFGLHPYFLNDDANNDVCALEAALCQFRQQICAIGEIGLDGVVDVPAQQQSKVFEKQLLLANDAHLPVIIHHRKTHHHIIASVKKTKFANGGIIHAFSGSIEVAKQYIDCGFLLGIGGTITYPRGVKTREAILATGLENLVLETDSPDMPLFGHQGKRNEPARVVDVAKVLSDMFQVTLEQVAKQTSQNYHATFNSTAVK